MILGTDFERFDIGSRNVSGVFPGFLHIRVIMMALKRVSDAYNTYRN